jgi:hypothetical protein
VRVSLTCKERAFRSGRPADRKRRLKRERNRRHEQRVRDHVTVVPVEVDAVAIQELGTVPGCLSEADLSGDRRTLARSYRQGADAVDLRVGARRAQVKGVQLLKAGRAL